MKRQIAAWALTGVMAVGHVADVQLPWHDADPAPAEISDEERLEVTNDLCKAVGGPVCDRACLPDDGFYGGCD